MAVSELDGSIAGVKILRSSGKILSRSQGKSGEGKLFPFR